MRRIKTPLSPKRFFEIDPRDPLTVLTNRPTKFFENATNMYVLCMLYVYQFDSIYVTLPSILLFSVSPLMIFYLKPFTEC